MVTARQKRQQAEADRIAGLNREIAAKKKTTSTVSPVIKLGTDKGVRKFASPEQEKVILETERKYQEEHKIAPTIHLGAKEEEKGILGKIGEHIESIEKKTLLGTITPPIQVPHEIRGATAVAGAAVSIAAGIIATSGNAAIIKATTIGKIHPEIMAKLQFTKNFATTTKSLVLTKSILAKAGLVAGALGIVGTIVGTYPFAQFELAEATDKIGIAMMKAANAKDWETVKELRTYLDDMVNPSAWENVVNKIPFANVLQNVKKNIAAAMKSSETYGKLVEQAAMAEPEEEKWARIFAEQNERKRKQREEDEKYWNDVQESIASAREEGRREDEKYWNDIYQQKREENAAKREEDEKYYKEIAEANTQEELEEMTWKAKYYDLIRQGKYEEAQELLEGEILR